jgi:hypothetical protein
MAQESVAANFPQVYIIGSDSLQNHMLALCMEKELAVECRCFSDLTTMASVATDPGRVCILLLDCSGHDIAALDKKLETIGAMPTATFFQPSLTLSRYHPLKNCSLNTGCGVFFTKKIPERFFSRGCRP